MITGKTNRYALESLQQGENEIKNDKWEGVLNKIKQDFSSEDYILTNQEILKELVAGSYTKIKTDNKVRELIKVIEKDIYENILKDRDRDKYGLFIASRCCVLIAYIFTLLKEKAPDKGAVPADIEDFMATNDYISASKKIVQLYADSEVS